MGYGYIGYTIKGQIPTPVLYAITGISVTYSTRHIAGKQLYMKQLKRKNSLTYRTYANS